jgi:hypothetical protein
MVFCFVQNFFFGQHELEDFFLSRKARFFFPEFNIRLYDKNSELKFFFLHQNQNMLKTELQNLSIMQRYDIEDEVHFLLQCPSLQKERWEIINNINEINKNFRSYTVPLYFGGNNLQCVHF